MLVVWVTNFKGSVIRFVWPKAANQKKSDFRILANDKSEKKMKSKLDVFDDEFPL